MLTHKIKGEKDLTIKEFEREGRASNLTVPVLHDEGPTAAFARLHPAEPINSRYRAGATPFNMRLMVAKAGSLAGRAPHAPRW